MAWQTKKLGDICNIQTGKWDANHAVQNGEYRFYTCAYDHMFCNTKRFSGECLILPGNGVNVGEIFYYNGEFDAYQRTYVINNIKILPKFLYYHLLSFWKERNLNKQFGSATNFLKIGNFLDYEIYYPESIFEQERIVKILDNVFLNLENVNENIKKNLQNSKILFESYLEDVFTKPKEKWESKSLGDVCNFIGGSQPPKSVFNKKKSSDNIRLIQIRDYKSDKNLIYIPRDTARRFCNVDDVMIGRYGPPLFQILRGLDGAYNVALMKAVPDELKISHDFLYYFLKNPSILKYVIYHSERAAGQIGLTKETLEPYPINFPSLVEQKNIVKKLESLSNETKKLESIYKQKLFDMAELKKSILLQAFSGEL